MPPAGAVLVRCDACGASARIGPRPADGLDAWCEACQRHAVIAVPDAPCPACGGELATGRPRFPDLPHRLDAIDGVLSAWAGDAGPLALRLPAMPDFHTDLRIPDPMPGVGGPVALADLLEDPATRVRDRLRRAVEHEERGDLAAAEAAWTEVLAHAESKRAHLARGALRARRGAWTLAESDFRLAGEGPEVRWNLAALRVHQATEAAPSLPPPDVIEEARRLAGVPDPDPESPTVGRLLWRRVVDRIVGRNTAQRLDADSPSRAGEDERLLRAAEQQLEFATFWDRAMVLAGYALTGMPRDAARVGRPLADEAAASVQSERAVAAETLRPLAGALALVRVHVAAGEPARARGVLDPVRMLDVLRRGRVPCVHCLAGTVGVEAARA